MDPKEESDLRFGSEVLTKKIENLEASLSECQKRSWFPGRNNGGIEWEKRGTEKNCWKNWILKITDVNKEAA